MRGLSIQDPAIHICHPTSFPIPKNAVLSHRTMREVPLVSVLLPVYNAREYVGDSIRSILDQTFTDFELLILNDGSTDGSEEIIRSFTDKRIVFTSHSNR